MNKLSNSEVKVSKTEMKHEVQDAILHHMKSAFYEADDNNWSEEKTEMLRREMTRVAKFLGYSDLGPI